MISLEGMYDLHEVLNQTGEVVTSWKGALSHGNGSETEGIFTARAIN